MSLSLSDACLRLSLPTPRSISHQLPANLVPHSHKAKVAANQWHRSHTNQYHHCPIPHHLLTDLKKPWERAELPHSQSCREEFGLTFVSVSCDKNKDKTPYPVLYTTPEHRLPAMHKLTGQQISYHRSLITGKDDA